MLKRVKFSEWNAWLHHITNEIPDIKANKPFGLKNTSKSYWYPFAYEYKDKKDSSKIKNVYSIWKPKKIRIKSFLRNYGVIILLNLF